MIYFTSDLHFGHQKDFLYAPRGFASIDEMNEEIITNWNQLIEPEDEVYVLGDLCLGGGSDEALQANQQRLQQLNGNLHIILGNHDSEKRIEMYKELSNVVEITYAMPFIYKKWHFWLSHYPTLCGNWDEGDKPLRARTINLCGHTHTKDRWADWGKAAIYHVELDAHNNTPVSIDEIIEDLKTHWAESEN